MYLTATFWKRLTYNFFVPDSQVFEPRLQLFYLLINSTNLLLCVWYGYRLATEGNNSINLFLLIVNFISVAINLVRSYITTVDSIETEKAKFWSKIRD